MNLCMLLLACLLTMTGALAGEPVLIPPADAAAGGWSDGGAQGAYFANPDLAGEPAFTRREVRIAHDWGETRTVGGLPGEPFRSFPHDGFSVRWTGRLIPRFSESYSLVCRSDGEVRLRIDGAERGPAGKPVSVMLTAGRPCEVVLEYRHRSGPARIELAWSCPSSPEQVIDPVAAQGLNASTWELYCFADEARTLTQTKGTVDAEGQPASDCSLLGGAGRQGRDDGTYLLTFRGKAEVARPGATFSAGGQSWAAVAPRGAGWDSASNTTRLEMSQPHREGHWYLELRRTARDGGEEKGDGVTGLHLMRPLTGGAAQAHPPGAITYQPFRAAVEPLTCLRWLAVGNVRSDGRWSSRTLPGYRGSVRGGLESGDTGGECWEYLIAMANECGKDLYVCLPMAADDAYVESFARLVRYGSDGRDPYDHDVASPVWPPLNANLRLYVEVGNEIWNWSFGSTQACNDRAKQEIATGTPDGKLINYDGQGSYRRWHALRTVRTADVFRRVSGDAAMGTRIRPLIEYQYANYQDTARSSLSFIDTWFGNGDGEHVAQPHPVRHWIWGAGAATYYATGNPDGILEADLLPDGGFESARIPAGSESSSPVGSGWICAGGAAIYRNWEVSIASFAAGKPGKVAGAAAAGCAFTVDHPTVLRALGAWMNPYAGEHRLVLRGPGGVIAQSRVKPAMIAVFQTRSWVWTEVAEAPRLEPGVTYHLLAAAEKGEPYLFAAPVAVAAGAGFTVVGAASVPTGAAADPATWTVQVLDGAQAYGPLAVRTAAAADAKPTTWPEPARGGQAAVLRPGSSLSTTITFPRAGNYALELHAAGVGCPGWPGYLEFRATIDGRPIDPNGQRDERVSTYGFGLGGFHRRTGDLNEVWGSTVIAIAKPGPVELRLVASERGSGATVIDGVRIVSADALLDSGFGAGQANGQVVQDDFARQLNTQAAYARGWGLPVVAYEAGWSLGGDFNSKPIHVWSKFCDDRARTINDTAQDIFDRSGGFMNVWGVYEYWPGHDMAAAGQRPMARSLAGISARLPGEPVVGQLAPCRLLPVDASAWHEKDRFDGVFAGRGAWRTWLVRIPSSGVWSIRAVGTSGQVWDLEVDGVPLGDADQVRVVRGLHGVRVRARGAGALSGIDIAPGG